MVKWDPGKSIRDPRGEITGVVRDSSGQGPVMWYALEWIVFWIERRSKVFVFALIQVPCGITKEKHRSSGKSFFFHCTARMSYEVSMASSLHVYSIQFHYILHQWREVQKILNGRNSCIIEVRLVFYCRRFYFSPTYAYRSLSRCLGKSRIETVRWNYM